MEPQFFDRDVSWLYFNGRVLAEAERDDLPLGDRIKFLWIYSSNLDEFFRVRIPARIKFGRQRDERRWTKALGRIDAIVEYQQSRYEHILLSLLTPLKEKHHIDFLYGKDIPKEIEEDVDRYFSNQVFNNLEIIFLKDRPDFFPENNSVYLVIPMNRYIEKEMAIIKLPTEDNKRFFSVFKSGIQYVVFLDDIILRNLPLIFPEIPVKDGFSFKVTRDAEMESFDSFGRDLERKVEEQLIKRDLGYITRFLYDGEMPQQDLNLLVSHLRLHNAKHIDGGRYHNMVDLRYFPINKNNTDLFLDRWPPIKFSVGQSIFDRMKESDFMCNPPYQDYETVVQFFKAAAEDRQVTDIYLTIYRVASESQIAKALIAAAEYGKKVTVFVELKARFDEANNLHWAEKMEAAGAQIIYSIPGWKVHAKVALVKRKENGRSRYYGILATGNFNEATAKIYADHILFTSHKGILRELELLFMFFKKRRHLENNPYGLKFQHLLIAQFNLLGKLKDLIDGEIEHAKAGKPAAITLKMNNLSDEEIISKLYEASNAGVKIRMLVRSICRLVPGVPGMSENITIKRIVDRYLEHGRIFIFHNDGKELIFSGSADWMDRNIRRRIEVCFPVYDEDVRSQLKKVLKLGLADNVQAVEIDREGHNVPVEKKDPPVQSQKEIYEYFRKRAQK